MRAPDLGAAATAALRVTRAELASALQLDDRDEFPPVYATSRMIALMEVAAARVLRPLLADGELSVGVTVEITHTAATPPGAHVTATARFTGMSGRLYVFAVTAEDEGGVVGTGTHQRAVVEEGRLVAGAGRRRGGAAPDAPLARR